MKVISGQRAGYGRCRGYLAARGGAICAVPAAGGGAGTTTDFLPMALLLAGFTAAGVWMFRRWGGKDALGRRDASAPQLPTPVGDTRPASV